ncbi:MAG: hypothetical protein GF388_03265 [Candidatus Aegiribacteria sp.]|nr:hypothetical protein [Candidatus Aegiribacteria sp.]MBD3294288.1 hypothetical protein [Candidatus Fermentibacteria bacterium]
MKKVILVLLIVISFCFSDLPEFADPFFVQASGTDLVVSGSVPDPCVVDWDGDGLKDLVIGQFSSGKVRFYPNSGTNAAPVFTSFSYLQAGGSDITMSYG